MQFPFANKEWDKNEWDQLKNLRKTDIISLIKKDQRWEFRGAKGARYQFYNQQIKPPYDYLTIHHHKEGFHNPGLLKNLLNHWCCTKDDLRKWKVIK